VIDVFLLLLNQKFVNGRKAFHKNRTIQGYLK